MMYTEVGKDLKDWLHVSSEVLPSQLSFLGLPCEYPQVSNLRLLFSPTLTK